MFFPHDLDFRGRAYPMHPHLNHMGPDFCRGLLCFAEAKPLGPNGLDWLFVQAWPLLFLGFECIPCCPHALLLSRKRSEASCRRMLRCMVLQIANSWGRGVDKRSFKERQKFAEQNITYIIDSAERPLDPAATRCCWQSFVSCVLAPTHGKPTLCRISS